MAEAMKPTQHLTAVQQILKDKLQEILREHKNLLDSLETLETEMDKVEGIVCGPDATKFKLTDSVHLAAYIDNMQEQLATCNQALRAVFDHTPMLPIAALSEVEKVTNQNQSTSESESSGSLKSKSPSGNIAAVNILQAQVVDLHKQIQCLSGSPGDELDSQLKRIEAKLCDLEKSVNPPADKYLQSRLEALEAKTALVEDMQFRNENSITDLSNEMTRMRIDLISSQQNMENITSRQEVQQKSMEKEMDKLVYLRNTLNQFHMNVTQRDELSKRVNKIEEQLTKLHCEMGSSEAQLMLAMQGRQDSVHDPDTMPVFAAVAQGVMQVVKPENTILFRRELYNEWAVYDAKTSTFEAPNSGLYMFSTSINADSAGTLTVAIVKNGDEVAQCATSGKKDEQTSTTILLHLSVGDKVWVKGQRQTSQEGVRIGRGFSNFIGYQIKKSSQ